MKIQKIRVDIYPLDGIELNGEYKIADHVNLVGKPVQHLGFIPITDLYVDKNNPDAIVVACLKPGCKPNAQETKILIENKVKAFTYSLIPEVLNAAANGYQIDATAYIPNAPQGFSFGNAVN